MQVNTYAYVCIFMYTYVYSPLQARWLSQCRALLSPPHSLVQVYSDSVAIHLLFIQEERKEEGEIYEGMMMRKEE
jgi:hypothetical protein